MDFLIAGLGNFSPEYEHTRHNIGFDIVDRLAARFEAAFDSRRHADVSQFTHKGKRFTLIKPTTYMNLSGKAVRYWLGKLKIEAANLLVVVDEINLPLGAIRIRPGGSDGGHNGLASVIEVLGTRDFPRLRFGIGDDYPRGRQSDFVLGRWTKPEWQVVEPRLDAAADAIVAFGLRGIERAMNEYNSGAN